MRTVLTALLAVSSVVALHAATPPERLTYQGVLRGSDGAPLDGPQEMVFRLWTDAVGGDEVLVDRHLAAGTGAVGVDAGVFSVPIGTGDVDDGAGPGSYTTLSAVFADHATLHLEIEINGETLAPRVRIGSTAYALNSASIDGMTTTDLAADTDARVETHRSAAAAHHGRYTDSEAVTAVGDSPLIPPGQCVGSDQVLRWDGSGWSCETLPPAVPGGPSGGNANGYAVIDPFGHAWDGLQRAPLPWAEADAACTALGGRLPTLSELWRVNNDDGFGTLTDVPVEDLLWTAIPSSLVANGIVVTRLSDGAITATSAGNPGRFRCTWPGTSLDAFDADDCFGAPGSTCRTTGLWHHADVNPRLYASSQTGSYAWLDLVTTSYECLLSGGQLPDLRASMRLSREGVDPTVQAWTTNLADAVVGRFATAIVGGPPTDSWGPFFGAADIPEAGYFSFCLGRRPGTPDVAPAVPSCEGGCYQPALGGSTLIADAASRTAATYPLAVETCETAGGRLPRMGEIFRLVVDGWTGGDDAWHWSADPGWDGGPVIATYRWSGDGDAYWQPGPDTDADAADSGVLPYRCVWPGAVEGTPTVCSANEDQTWNGSAFSCAPPSDGSSAGQAAPSEFVDAWGNAWDASVRSYGVLADAAAACDAVGARLPTATELYRVRHANGIAPALGDATATELLWTTVPAFVPGSVVATRLADGSISIEEDNNENAYRCIWPASRGDVLSGRSCHADPAASCFQAGGLRIDRLDRPPLPYAGAAFECELDGGQLPLLDELTRVIRAGAPNGSDTPLWTEHPVVVGTDERYVGIGWSGTGPATWSVAPADVGTINPSNGTAPFRCVFSVDHDF